MCLGFRERRKKIKYENYMLLHGMCFVNVIACSRTRTYARLSAWADRNILLYIFFYINFNDTIIIFWEPLNCCVCLCQRHTQGFKRLTILLFCIFVCQIKPNAYLLTYISVLLNVFFLYTACLNIFFSPTVRSFFRFFLYILWLVFAGLTEVFSFHFFPRFLLSVL